MDKEKLTAYLDRVMDTTTNFAVRQQINYLLVDIYMGYYDKQHCDHCIEGHYRDLKGGAWANDVYPFCPKCGRDLRTK
jgi:hypothetical protein